ncbi:UNVERIFIED_CONTAM: hypothetical protein PYX00_011204 [Menopon gallinae]|uniref:Adenylosuccinate synthetase n=1 Tax=Menopon gallinae TaxID=328185 RepID=A0AAW2H6F4_9NEOP
MDELLNPRILREKIEKNLKIKNVLFSKYFDQPELDSDKIYNEFLELGEKLKPRIVDTELEINQAIKKGKNILFEGAQALMLDIDFGTYPYVTSSSPSTGGVCIGAGVAPTYLQNLIGVAKAYSTRVGNGPFPSEFDEEFGERIRRIGHEFWYGNSLVITKLDVMTGLAKLKVATHYKHKEGKIIDYFTSSTTTLYDCQPIYKELEGWEEDITKVTVYDKLPGAAKRYIGFIEEYLGVANQKGGVGKTTTSVNLASALGVLEKKVLLIDADPQANTTSGLGIEEVYVSTYDVLENGGNIRESIRKTTSPNLDIIPSHIDLVAAEIELVDKERREYMLKEAVKEVKDEYDYIIIDCAPSLGLITINALTAANSVIIPIQCEYFALEGLGKLLNTIKNVQKIHNSDLAIEVDDQELLEIALVENLQREDLDPIEVALTYQRLIYEIGLTQEDLSSRIGLGIATWNNKQYNRYRTAFIAELNGKKHEFSGISGITKEVLGHTQDRMKRQRDYAIAITAAAYQNTKNCLELGIPVICGTTGWLDKKNEIEAYAIEKKTAFLYASNFSLGVNLFFALNERLAKLMAPFPEYHPQLKEIHHSHKLDVPSGTAITLAEGVIENSYFEAWKLEETKVDEIEIKHTAFNRNGFAFGAVIASEWINGKKGIYTMHDVLGL